MAPTSPTSAAVASAKGVPAPARHGLLVLAGFAAAALPMAFAALLPQGALSRPAHDLLHSLLQLFLVVIGGATFAIQWYAAARGLEEARGRFLGAAFLGLAILEAFHLLLAPGMPGLFAAADREAAGWHLGRLWMVAALLAAAFVPERSDHVALRRGPLLAVVLSLVAVLLAADVRTLELRHLFHPDGGPTLLRSALGWAGAAAAGFGALLHVWRHRQTGERLYHRVAMALGLVVLGEGAFGAAQAGDALGLMAHLYAAVSGWLVYDALFAAALLDPYLRLARTTRELEASNAYLERLRGRIEGELADTIGRLHQTTEAEAKARAELEAAIAAVPEGILVVSPEGQVIRQNEMSRQLFANAPSLGEDTVMARWRLLRPRTTEGKPIALEDHPVLRALRGETVRGAVMVVEPPGRKATWVTVSAAPVRLDGNLVGAVAAVADVSALQELQTQLEDLLRSVSHDLRNPLQIVLLQGERLLRLSSAAGDEKVRHSATAVIAASRQMGAMIRDLVDAARMEAGRMALTAQPLDLRAWLPQLLSVSAGALDTARVRLDLAADLPLVRADPSRLDRVLLNLLANALRHSPSGREVRVSGCARGDQVELVVQDQGDGIDPEDLPHLFERFYRGKASAGDGLGLGLFIVRLMVEAHGGHIRAESRLGEGSTFTVTLPRALPEQA